MIETEAQFKFLDGIEPDKRKNVPRISSMRTRSSLAVWIATFIYIYLSKINIGEQ